MTYQLLERALAGLLIAGAAASCHRQAPEHELVAAREDAIRIERFRVDDGKAHFFTYQHEGKNVNFFIRTDGAGTIRAHFDACYSCFKYKRGYVQEGQQVVCIACRIGYDLDTPTWDFVGPCVPVTLKCRTNDAGVIVPVSALEKGARLF